MRASSKDHLFYQRLVTGIQKQRGIHPRIHRTPKHLDKPTHTKQTSNGREINETFRYQQILARGRLNASFHKAKSCFLVPQICGTASEGQRTFDPWAFTFPPENTSVIIFLGEENEELFPFNVLTLLNFFLSSCL